MAFEVSSVLFSLSLSTFLFHESLHVIQPNSFHHHGIYAYRAGVLRRLVAAPPSKLELAERLEQLRALSLGMKIRVAVPGVRPGPGVDTEADLEAVARDI